MYTKSQITMTNLLQKPSIKDQKLAKKSLKFLQALNERAETQRKVKIKINPAGEETTIKIPVSAMNVLYTVISEMAEGKSVTVIPSEMARRTEEDSMIARARIW